MICANKKHTIVLIPLKYILCTMNLFNEFLKHFQPISTSYKFSTNNFCLFEIENSYVKKNHHAKNRKNDTTTHVACKYYKQLV